MKTLEIIGYQRANLGKQEAKRLRGEGMVPCVLYGGTDQVHFYSPMILFRELVYTPDLYFVHLNIEGAEYNAVIQEAQFHPVSDMILHVDFLQLFEEKPIKMEVPITFVGDAPGVVKGGKLLPKLRTIKVKALPRDMPETIEVSISNLDLGKSVKIRELEEKNYTILNSPSVSIATIEIPRGLRGAAAEAEKA
jgi:large subunit ribosomal protein L25